MEKTKLKVQSFIDLITNSSTEVFTICTDRTIKAAKDLLSAMTGLDINEVEDKFEFKLVIDDAESDYIDDYYSEIKDYYGQDFNIYQNYDKILNDLENKAFELSETFDEYVERKISSGNTRNVNLYINTKNNKYKKYIKLIDELILSVDNEAFYG